MNNTPFLKHAIALAALLSICNLLPIQAIAATPNENVKVKSSPQSNRADPGQLYDQLKARHREGSEEKFFKSNYPKLSILLDEDLREGKLTRASFEKAYSEHRKNLRLFFEKLDYNSDGRISALEARLASPAVSKRFTQYDKDGDGYLSFSEFLNSGAMIRGSDRKDKTAAAIDNAPSELVIEYRY